MYYFPLPLVRGSAKLGCCENMEKEEIRHSLQYFCCMTNFNSILWSFLVKITAVLTRKVSHQNALCLSLLDFLFQSHQHCFQPQQEAVSAKNNKLTAPELKRPKLTSS